MTRIQEFETTHHDRVTVVDHNLTGKRMLTASADHRIKVYERATVNSEPILKDTWHAHDADIRDAKWFHPTLGTHLASISNDLTLKIWIHDPSQASSSGRTFHQIARITSHSGVPFVSLSIKHIAPATTYLAVIDRLGTLIILTPTSPESFSDWMQIAKFNVVDSGPPSRTTETCFNVTFDPNVNNVPYILNLPSSNQNIISLAVSSLDCLKIYRSSPTSPSHFYEAARSPPHPALIRSIAWANGNIRGYDTIATGCADGGIRIFDLSTSAPPTQEPQSSSTSTTPSSTAAPGSTPSTTSKPIPQSSLTTAIVGRSVQQQQQQQQHNQSSAQSTRRNKPNGSYAHSLLLTCSLESHHRDCLAVRFDQTGTLLASMDADGTTIYWKRSVGLHNLWDYSGNTNASDSESLTTAPGAVRSEWLVFAVESEGESEDEDGTNGGEKLGTVEKGGGGGGGAGDGEGIRMGEE